MELNISPEFIKKFRIDNIKFEYNILEYDANNGFSKGNVDCLVKKNINNYFNCKDLFFRFKLNGEFIEFEPEKKPFYYFILNGLLIESIINHLDNEIFQNIYQPEDSYNAKISGLFHLWNCIDRKKQAVIKQLFCENIIILEIYIDEFEKIYRYKTNVRIGKKILSALLGEKKINTNYLSKNTKVALYGAGNIGKILSLFLKKKNIGISFYIDECDATKSYKGIPIVKCSDLTTRNDFDLIVVTPVFDFEQIYENLRTYTKKTIISLDEAIK